MEKIRIIKTIEEMPTGKALNLCLQVLEKPKEITQENWANQIKKDLITGKKSFRIRELVLKERAIDGR
jgi:hypothetical protein